MVRLSKNGSFEIYKWEDKFKRHTRIDSNKTLNTDINSYAYKIYGSNIEISATEIDIMTLKSADFIQRRLSGTFTPQQFLAIMMKMLWNLKYLTICSTEFLIAMKQR